jgi:prophage regulatory protein
MNASSTRSRKSASALGRGCGASQTDWLNQPPQEHTQTRQAERYYQDLPSLRNPIRMLRLAQVIDATGLRRSKIYELQAQGDFPRRVKIASRSVGWVEAEVQAWLAQRIAQSGASER